MRFWLRLRGLFGLWMLLAATNCALPSICAYGVQNQKALDNVGESFFAYDSLSALTASEKKYRMAEGCVLLAKSAEFLAAEETGCHRSFVIRTRAFLGYEIPIFTFRPSSSARAFPQRILGKTEWPPHFRS
jgi:hypothetical protein